MAQISLFEKRKNYSDKDITVTVGMNDQIYITFRHYSYRLMWIQAAITMALGFVCAFFGRKCVKSSSLIRTMYASG